MIPDVEAAEIHKTGHRWIDLSVAACALIVSITSLSVAILHGRTMERMADANARLVEANSLPLLQRFSSDVGPHGEPITSIVVANAGVGPAKVASLEVFWNGQPVDSPVDLAIACCGFSADPAKAAVNAEQFQTSSVGGTVMRAGESRSLYVFTQTAASASIADKLRVAGLKLTFKACFCSVFDECWVSDLLTLNPEKVQSCPVPARPFRATQRTLTGAVSGS